MFASNTSQVSSSALYIETVFSAYLFDGNGATQVINNGIDLANKGGMVWTKARNQGTYDHQLFDTLRGTNKALSSNTTGAEASLTNVLNSFNYNGFTLGASANANQSGNTEVSWTFREQSKFFDIVTYTGNGASRTIPHNLGSAPGCIMIKCTSTTSDWIVYHRGLPVPATGYMNLNTTAAVANAASMWFSTTPTSTEFSLGTNTAVNDSGQTYVAYLFAHNAGGFGVAGTDNVISCGSYTGNGSTSGPTINLGYEPQWLLIKNASNTWNWVLFDNMRGMSYSSAFSLSPNTTGAESSFSPASPIPTATGFNIATTAATLNESGSTFIYIAIRRGPMRTPTSGLSVFSPVLSANTSPAFVTGFPVDSGWVGARSTVDKWYQTDRLRGFNILDSASNPTAGEAGSSGNGVDFDYQNGFWDNIVGTGYIGYGFRRAPGFFDTVCYSGNSSTTAYNHNLGVAPELIIIKARNAGLYWPVWCIHGFQQNAYSAVFNGTNAYTTQFELLWGGTSTGTPSMTSTTFRVGTATAVNESGYNYVAYLFASCNGVSKVGTYTGTGATQTISCGFAARFVMVKRIDTTVSNTASWWVVDTTRGMVAGTDPRLAFNVNSTETNLFNTIYTNANGFQIVTTDATINASGGVYIYLAIS